MHSFLHTFISFVSQVSSKAVQDLRRKSGAGMMDCKKALAENNNDMEAASDWLRKKVGECWRVCVHVCVCVCVVPA